MCPSGNESKQLEFHSLNDALLSQKMEPYCYVPVDECKSAGKPSWLRKYRNLRDKGFC